MKLRRGTLFAVFVLVGLACVHLKSLGQVDSSWLKSWNEAQESRPLTLSASARIAAADEPGIPFIINGEVLKLDGTPAIGAVIHAYHRDKNGLDFGPNDNSLTTWRLQGWVKTDAKGRFEFQTIRPAPDHLGREAAHIHFILVSGEPGRQWLPTVFLSDEPLVTANQRKRSRAAGEYGWVREVNFVDGVQHVNVKIQLKKTADF